MIVSRQPVERHCRPTLLARSASAGCDLEFELGLEPSARLQLLEEVAHLVPGGRLFGRTEVSHDRSVRTGCLLQKLQRIRRTCEVSGARKIVLSTSVRPLSANTVSMTCSPPRAKMPGCPRAGGDLPAWRRRMAMGFAMNGLLAGVVKTKAANRPPLRSLCLTALMALPADGGIDGWLCPVEILSRASLEFNVR
jgi:hypothetical protein